MDIRKDNEAVASGHLFQRYRAPLLRALHHCLVKKVMYHSRATFKEALKQVIYFSKLSKNYGKTCQRRQLSSVQLQNFT